MCEANRLDGKLHGRTRVWLRDGTLIQEIFYFGNVEVSRAKYLKNARKHPAWPQYEGEAAGRVARAGRNLKHKEHELFIESLLEKKHVEAVQWLTAGKRPGLRSLAKFRTTKAALRFVENLYAVGAETVFALPIYAGKHRKVLPGKPQSNCANLPLQTQSGAKTLPGFVRQAGCCHAAGKGNG